MNNKGLTLVELITTFALTAAIVVLLINVVVVIKNVYSNTTIKTELYIKQANLSNILNSKINYGTLKSYETCDEGTFCYKFTLEDEESEEEEIELNVTENKITFGDYVYELTEISKVENPSLKEEDIDKDDSNDILVLTIPIKCELYPNIDFGINLVYLY